MADTRAYIYPIDPDPAYGNSVPDEDAYVNESSPSWILTFIRWRYRDTLRIVDIAKYNQSQSQNQQVDLKAVEETLVVRNDCISVSVTCNKGSYTPTMEATLVNTNVNYLTEIAPGDFVFVNMLNWESDAEDVAQKADTAKSAINEIDDGFKGFFKVQSVRRVVAIINPQTGTKGVITKITGYAFTEFNNAIYFNQSVALQQAGFLTFAAQISQTWASLLQQKQPFSLRELIQLLTQSFIGTGFPGSSVGTAPGNTPGVTTNISQTANTKFYMPSVVGTLLGLPNVNYAADTYNFIFGLQQYSATNPNTSTYTGLNPAGLQQQSGSRFWFTPDDCPGTSILKPEYWDQVKTWDILNQYTNRPVNEFFSCFRLAPNSNNVMPTVVFRQIPFTNEDFTTTIGNQGTVNMPKVTRFMTLPRWKINPALVISEDIGRDEAARINYVQIFARSLLGSGGTDYTQETIKQNYVQDINDIQRSGLRPSVMSSLFDLLPQDQAEIYHSPFWAKIVGDALIGGHLKYNGTLICAGIVDPIAIGDNVEYNGIVYHIEQVTHRCEIVPATGNKSFRTILSLSNGLDVHSSSQYGTIYPGMKYGNAYAERVADYANSQILPGVSESQDIPQRNGNLEQVPPVTQPNKSFPQPQEIKLFPSQPTTPKKGE